MGNNYKWNLQERHAWYVVKDIQRLSIRTWKQFPTSVSMEGNYHREARREERVHKYRLWAPTFESYDWHQYETIDARA